MRKIWALMLLTGAGLMLTVGSGCSEFRATPAGGRVTYEGQTVTGGTVTFTPQGIVSEDDERNTGKRAMGQITSNGEFLLTTFEFNDGAVIGSHIVYVGDATWAGKEARELEVETSLATAEKELTVLRGALRRAVFAANRTKNNRKKVDESAEKPTRPVAELKKEVASLQEKIEQLENVLPFYFEKKPVTEVEVVRGENMFKIDIKGRDSGSDSNEDD